MSCVDVSVVKPEPDFLAGIGAGAGENEPIPGCCCVLRWQSCDNSDNFSQIITIVTKIDSLLKS